MPCNLFGFQYNKLMPNVRFETNIAKEHIFCGNQFLKKGVKSGSNLHENVLVYASMFIHWNKTIIYDY